MTIEYMMPTAEMTESIIEQNRVRHRCFSPPCGGYCSFGIATNTLEVSGLYVMQQVIYMQMLTY